MMRRLDFDSTCRPYPKWAWKHGLHDVRINEAIRKTIMFLGIETDRGEFAPYGTGFLTVYSEDGITLPYIVTAKHVVTDIKNSGRPFRGRLNDHSGRRIIGELFFEHWDFHPTNQGCDVAVSTFGGSFNSYELRAIDLDDTCITDAYVEENQIGAGDEVFTVGLLTHHIGTHRNIPIVRMGNIAAMIEEPVYLGPSMGSQEVYLIESRSIGGLSGSPVFLNTPPFRRIDGAMHEMAGHLTEYFLGVNIGLFKTVAQRDLVDPDDGELREQFMDNMSAGIAVVVPASRVLEIIQGSPTMRQIRKEVRERVKKENGFVPTSVATVEAAPQPAPEAENPDHREDFTRPLSAAAKKRPQDPQT